MIASAHVAAGAVAGLVATRVTKNLIGRIVLAAILGVASHMALDAIPHSDYAFLPFRLYGVVGITETVVATSLILLIVRKRLQVGSALALAAGIAASLAPDMRFLARLVWPSKATSVERVGNSFHWFHADTHPDRMIYLAAEITITIVLFALFARLSKPVAGAR